MIIDENSKLGKIKKHGIYLQMILLPGTQHLTNLGWYLHKIAVGTGIKNVLEYLTII